ncbi:ParB/RepB/Spo0J family partition protein [Micrococcus lylae]|uniref:ParB/RepB/Spo0J family partition protein n=1 Tax=Micrococcus lylae TaxID=1273 RepID=UPI001FD7C7EC|nr:ParB/RepB/Spo0J family partition protein [Micrococcus lylae]
MDVFFSSDRTSTEGDAKGGRATTAAEERDTTAVEEHEQTVASSASSRSAAGRKSTVRRGRPSMPAVNALGRRAPAEPAEAETEAEKVSEKSAAGSVPATTDVTAGAEVSEAGTVPTDIAVLRELKVTDIHPNPRQPREVFDEDHMDELVTSITEVGILQPIVVREVAGPTPYELIMGERRWRATQLAGLDTIPAIVRHTPDEDLLRDALLENLHRSQLNPLEEAAAYQQLMDDFECTQEELSQRIGRSRPQISNTLRLMKLPPLVQRRVANNTLTAGHARALLGLTDPAEMERLAQRIVSEGLSVRATEEAVALAQGVRQAAPATRRRSEPTRHERLDYFATALTSRLDTQVKITLGKRKGKIAIDFASVEDLNRIMELIQGDDAEK